MVAAIGSAIELVVLVLAGFIVFRRMGHTLSEAVAYGVMTTFLLVSCLYQTLFLIGFGALTWGADIILMVAAVTVIVKQRKWLRSSFGSVVRFFPRHWLPMVILTVLWIYLTGIAFWLPAESIHWPALNQVLVLQRQNGFFSNGIVQESTLSSFVLAPSNITMLAHFFLRNNTDMGVGLLGLLAYMSIGFTTYALARRYAWPATALTVALMVISMPRCVYAASRPSMELLSSAAAVFCLLVIYRIIERPNIWDLIILFFAILGLMTHHALSPVFPLLMVALTVILLFRRHGTSIWWRLIRDNRWIVLAMLPLLMVFSQVWLIAYNMAIHHTWTDPMLIEELAYNHDGLQGLGANLLRYVFENAHFTNLVDRVCHWMLGFKISSLLQSVYDHGILPFTGMKGATEVFQIRWVPNEIYSWFGPFGCLLSIPAVGYSLVRAPRRLKAIVVALLAYLMVIALILAWQPENVRFFSLFFVCSGVCMAFFLSPWRIARRGRRILQLTAGLLLLYACFFDQMKPAFTLTVPAQSAPSGIGSKTRSNVMAERPISLQNLRRIQIKSPWTKDPWIMANRYFGDNRVVSILSQIPDDATLYMIYKNRSGIYPFLLGLPPTVRTILLDASSSSEVPLTTRDDAYLLFIDTLPASMDGLRHDQILWQSETDPSLPKGGLYYRN